MQCKEVQEHWESYSKGKLNKAEEQCVAQHLQSCAKCRKEFKALNAAKQDMQKIFDKKAPPGMWANIEDSLLPKRERSWQENVLIFPKQHKLAMSMAVAVLIVSLLGIQVDQYKGRMEVEKYLNDLASYIQTDEKMFTVTNRLDKNEKFNVYLGKPIGCTCGKEGCEHILAVLRG